MAFSKLSLHPLVFEHLTEIIDGSITEKKLFHEFNRFLFSKETQEINYDSDDLYVFKSDIERIITIIANDIIYYSLNKMVDKGLMVLCWDKKSKDFLWLEK